MSPVIHLLQQFETVSLDDMKKVRLMNRIDTKFVTTRDRLLSLLAMAGEQYFVQEIGGELDMPYRTLYFDTPGRTMYVEHLRGRLSRQKIRMRTYESSGLTFLEVKNKNNRGRTDKKRVVCTKDSSPDDCGGFLDGLSHYDVGTLSPSLENRFRRITLVNRRMTERLTIDTGLRFRDSRLRGAVTVLDSLVIIELKRDGLMESPVSRMLNMLRIHPSGFSKYCMGLALTDRELRHNRFKPRLRMVGRLCEPAYGGDELFETENQR